MRPSKRSCGAAAVLAGVAAAAAVAVPSGSAQTPGATTLSFYQPDAQSMFRITDNPPKSPVRNPESSKFRFSFGDGLTISAPLYDRKGGTRLGTLYAAGTVVKGKTFRDTAIHVNGTYVLNDASQIAVQGVLGFASDKSTFSIVGGSGKYEAARGHVTSTSDNTSSTDTLTLLP
jgi:Dirigent-like protein